MLLIFGLSVYFRTVAQGMFHCPACGGDRKYRRRAGRRWISVFFLPVIPLNSLGEAVECRECKTRFNNSVLRLPTAAAMEEALPAAMRAAHYPHFFLGAGALPTPICSFSTLPGTSFTLPGSMAPSWKGP